MDRLYVKEFTDEDRRKQDEKEFDEEGTWEITTEEIERFNREQCELNPQKFTEEDTEGYTSKQLEYFNTNFPIWAKENNWDLGGKEGHLNYATGAFLSEMDARIEAGLLDDSRIGRYGELIQ